MKENIWKSHLTRNLHWNKKVIPNTAVRKLPNLNRAKQLLDTSTKNIQKANIQKIFQAQSHWEMQIKTMVSYDYTHAKMAKNKLLAILNAGEDVEQPIHCQWDCIKDKNIETMIKFSCLNFLCQQRYICFSKQLQLNGMYLSYL